MSAWLCSENHISAMVTYAVDHDILSQVKAAPTFKMLVKENIRSLSSRYPGRDFLADWKREAKRYKFKPIAGHSATQIVKACNCFDYQACETDDYYTTNAASFVDQLRERAKVCGGKTEGALYDAAKWGIE